MSSGPGRMLADAGIVTLCDANYFPGLLMLHRSVQESRPCPVACYDAGLMPEQKDQAAGIADLHVLPLPDDPLIDSIRATMGGQPLAKANKREWPLWICPLLIKHAPFHALFWMDCDLIVLRNLGQLFAALRDGPVFTPENKAPQRTPNRPELYELLPIDRVFDPLVPTVNGGVSGWQKPRDADAIEAYIAPVRRAVDDPRVRQAISWHDQGALIWAIQSRGLERFVATTTAWNLCVDHTSVVRRPIPWDDGFLDAARREVPAANVLHWNGRTPPWIQQHPQ